ncbi:MAG: hypothetical protein QW228_03095 [Candidatus Aenigmatarchaeota archaeon]
MYITNSMERNNIFIKPLQLSDFSRKILSGLKTLFRTLIVGVIAIIFVFIVIMLSLFLIGFLPHFLNLGASYSYPEKEVKVMIKNTILGYLNEKTMFGERKRSIELLTVLGPSFSGSFDGYEICNAGVYNCKYGEREGENINYLYCKPTLLPPYIFCYKKTITSSSGEIQNVIKNCVYSFVLDPKTLEVVSIEFGPLHRMAESWC